MKVSIITCTYNSEKTVEDTIRSVNQQTYSNIEHIIVDGLSNDNTLKVIEANKTERQRVISEKDYGIYDGMNKGIRLSTGDIIGILNSDDFFSSTDIVEKIVNSIKKNNVDAVYGDVHFVNPKNVNKSIRYYSSKIFNTSLFKFGFMPAHPSFYAKRELYDKYGLYDINYKIASDFDLLIRYLYKERINTRYLPIDFVTMRIGGASTKNLKSKLTLNLEIIRSCKRNGIYTNLFILSFKYLYKILECIKR